MHVGCLTWTLLKGLCAKCKLGGGGNTNSNSNLCCCPALVKWNCWWYINNNCQWWMFWLLKRWRAQRTVVSIVNCRIPWTNWILIYLPVGNAYWHVCFNAVFLSKKHWFCVQVWTGQLFVALRLACGFCLIAFASGATPPQKRWAWSLISYSV